MIKRRVVTVKGNYALVERLRANHYDSVGTIYIMLYVFKNEPNIKRFVKCHLKNTD